MTQKKLIIFVGPSGCGKSTLAKWLTKEFKIPQVITHTTRKPRLTEQTNVDYYFETLDSFKRLNIIESTLYDNAQYGSSMIGFEKATQNHNTASIVLDEKGTQKWIEELHENAIVISIFNHNPSLTDAEIKQQLIQRLISRSDDPVAINQRQSKTTSSIRSHRHHSKISSTTHPT